LHKYARTRTMPLWRILITLIMCIHILKPNLVRLAFPPFTRPTNRPLSRTDSIPYNDTYTVFLPRYLAESTVALVTCRDPIRLCNNPKILPPPSGCSPGSLSRVMDTFRSPAQKEISGRILIFYRRDDLRIALELRNP